MLELRLLGLFGLPGGYEVIIIIGLFVLLFGASRLPSMMRSMGRSVNEFKAGLSDKPTDPEKNEEKDEHE